MGLFSRIAVKHKARREERLRDRQKTQEYLCTNRMMNTGAVTNEQCAQQVASAAFVESIIEDGHHDHGHKHRDEHTHSAVSSHKHINGHSGSSSHSHSSSGHHHGSSYHHISSSHSGHDCGSSHSSHDWGSSSFDGGGHHG